MAATGMGMLLKLATGIGVEIRAVGMVTNRYKYLSQAAL